MGRTRAALAALLVAGLLASCSEDDPEPDIADPTTSAPTGTASESASPSAKPTGLATPKSTVAAWVAVWNAALSSGDTRAIHRLETPDCRNCAAISAVIDDVVAAGGSFQGGEWSIGKSKVVVVDERRVKVNVAMSVAEGSTINSAGEEPVHYEADKRIVVYELERTAGSWLVDAIELLS